MNKLKESDQFLLSDIMVSFGHYVYTKLDGRLFRYCVFDNTSFNVDKRNVVCYTFGHIDTRNIYRIVETISYQIIGLDEF